GDAPGVALERHVALEHGAAQLAVPVATGLDLEGRVRLALEVLHLLRFPEGPGEEHGAVADVPEGHQVRPARRPERGAGQHALLVEEALELRLGHRDLAAARRDVSTLACGPRRDGAACPRGSA